MNPLLLGAAVWLVTLIIVESELFRPLRLWVRGRALRSLARRRRTGVVWDRLRYLVSCRLCTGVWVGQAVAHADGHGVLMGLVLSAVAHLLLVVEHYAESRIADAG